MHSLLDDIRTVMSRHGCIGPGVVAVSGGADSVALLLLLAEWATAFDTHLIVAHVNHQLRGDESDGDETFVQNLVEQLDRQASIAITFRCKRIDARTVSDESKDNLEATARRLRYEWFSQVCREEQANWLATGHTADDQAETVLFRLLRGAGLRGLIGVSAYRPLDDFARVIRPLLRLRRAQLIEYLRYRDQPYRTDASNADFRFTRNRIRYELLPSLQHAYNPNLSASLCQLAEQAESAYQSIEQYAKRLLQKSERPRAGDVLVFAVADLQTETSYIVCEMFRLVWRREGWPMSAMTFDHWNKLAEIAAAGGESDFPGFVHAVRRGRVVQLRRTQRPATFGDEQDG